MDENKARSLLQAERDEVAALLKGTDAAARRRTSRRTSVTPGCR
jgi:hypothetical protein